MDIFSTVIAILFIFFLIRGAWRGLAGELAPFVGILACIGILWFSYAPIQRFLTAQFPTLEPNAATFYSALLASTCGGLGFIGISVLVKKVVSFIVPQPFNAILGALIGIAKVFLIVSILGGLFTMGKNQLQEAREASDRNPFLATASQFWMARLEQIPYFSTQAEENEPFHTPKFPTKQKGDY